MFLRYVYMVFIGILISTFVGVGIQAFYPPPKAPEAPTAPVPYPQAASPSAELTQRESQYNAQWRVYQSKREIYDRDVSIVSSAAAIVLLVLSITVIQKMTLIADGTLLGGVITESYSIFRGFSSGDDKVRFVVVTIGLVIALVLGYIKFLKPQKA